MSGVCFHEAYCYWLNVLLPSDHVYRIVRKIKKNKKIYRTTSALVRSRIINSSCLKVGLHTCSSVAWRRRNEAPRDRWLVPIEELWRYLPDYQQRAFDIGISDWMLGVAMRFTPQITPSWYQSPWSGYGDSFFPWRCVSSSAETKMASEEMKTLTFANFCSRSSIAGTCGWVEWCVCIHSYYSRIRGASSRRGYRRAPWEWWVGKLVILLDHNSWLLLLYFVQNMLHLRWRSSVTPDSRPFNRTSHTVSLATPYTTPKALSESCSWTGLRRIRMHGK